jgi:hypothetical protein
LHVRVRVVLAAAAAVVLLIAARLADRLAAGVAARLEPVVDRVVVVRPRAVTAG